jgi:class 3 adenylate cyclase/tetratricopeptide (TPR) repeat protein
MLGVVVCGSCGMTNPDGQRFCGQCGADLTRLHTNDQTVAEAGGARYPIGVSGSHGPVAERKLATVLFADVVGFTSLAERTDHELVARMVDAAFKDLGEVVTQHGGTIDKYMGDSVMAVFGVPAAHDDDAERAVAAAFAIRQLGGDLVFSIGINSGEVMATAVGRGDVTVIGDTVNVAARLEKAASPGQVLCGRLTTELVGSRVNFRSRQPILLKGKREPVEVWEALSLHRVPAARGDDDLPLVGRETESAFLESQWRRVAENRQGSLVVVCGEAGVGKTRLLNEVARSVEEESLVICAAYPGYGAMGGIRLAGEVIAQLGKAEDPEVETRVRSVAGEIDVSLRSMDPPALRQEQVWAFGRLLKEKSKDRPVVVLIDDMHRADERTLDLLKEVDSRLSNVPLLTILAGRTEPGEWLTRFPAATTLRLGPLGRSETAALANAFVCEKPLSPEASDLLMDLSGGNALYVRELVSMARSQGMLVDDGGSRFDLAAHTGIPATLQALLAARLDALDANQKQVVQLTAVLGEATAEQVSALGVSDASGVLEELVGSGLLVRGPDGEYRTADSLLREVAYEMLPRNVRGGLHRYASTLTATPEDRARHLDQAARYLADDDELRAEASEALVQVGTALIEASRHLDAMRLLERAVALGATSPSVLIELAKIQALCGKDDQALETLSIVEDDPDDPSIAAERDHTSANAKIFVDPSWSVPRLEELATRWRSLGNIGKEAWAHANAGVANFNLSQMEKAGDELERALELFERVDDRSGIVATSSFLVFVKPTDPRVDRWLDQAVAFSDQAGDKTRKISSLAALAWRNYIRSMCGSSEEMHDARKAALELAELSEELGATDMAIHGRSLLAIMARHTGRLDEAEQQILSLQSLPGTREHYGTWLGWAASFAVTMASGAAEAAPPFPPDTSKDPVDAMADLVIESELVLMGRTQEALARFESTGPPIFDSPLAEVGSLFYAAALVVTGRGPEAQPWINRAMEAARALDATPALIASAALTAEVQNDATMLDDLLEELPPGRSFGTRSIAGALVMRARAVGGDASALEALDSLVRTTGGLSMPGLMLGITTEAVRAGTH